MKNKAFTLVELLVVVLIIGILAAIAVPQYQKAVVKTRYNNLKALTTAIYRAEQNYYLANNSYADTFDELDINVPSRYNNGYDTGKFCVIEKGDSYLYCRDNSINMSYFINFFGARVCIVYSEEPIINAICQAETGQATAYYGRYYYPGKI